MAKLLEKYKPNGDSKWDMWLGSHKMRTVDERFSGVEPDLAESMKNMMIGDSMFTGGHYNYQIIRKS